MKIIDSRAGAGSNYGMACGPVGLDQASAEICILDKEETKWISLNWQSEFPEILQVNIADASLFPYYSGLQEYKEESDKVMGDAFDMGDYYTLEDLSEYDGPYPELLPRLLSMLVSVLEANEYLSADMFEEEENCPWYVQLSSKSW